VNRRSPLPLPHRSRSLLLLPLALILLPLLACGGPRARLLTDSPRRPFDPQERVDLYIGQLEPPFEEVAVIDSDAYPEVTDEIKQRQIEQLQARARQRGANTLHEVRILAKQVKGFTPDEKTPFASWKQGRYELYFMRATAIVRPHAEPASMEEVRPAGGWAVDGLSPPPRLQQVMAPIPMPGLRTGQADIQVESAVARAAYVTN
jgi:hypothetical protein